MLFVVTRWLSQHDAVATPSPPPRQCAILPKQTLRVSERSMSTAAGPRSASCTPHTRPEVLLANTAAPDGLTWVCHWPPPRLHYRHACLDSTVITGGPRPRVKKAHCKFLAMAVARWHRQMSAIVLSLPDCPPSGTRDHHHHHHQTTTPYRPLPGCNRLPWPSSVCKRRGNI